MPENEEWKKDCHNVFLYLSSVLSSHQTSFIFIFFLHRTKLSGLRTDVNTKKGRDDHSVENSLALTSPPRQHNHQLFLSCLSYCYYLTYLTVLLLITLLILFFLSYLYYCSYLTYLTYLSVFILLFLSY